VDTLGLILAVGVHPGPGWGAVGFRAGAWRIAAAEEDFGVRGICGGLGGVGGVVLGLGAGDYPSVGRGLQVRGSGAWVDCGATFGWLNRDCRLSKDYEFLPETSEGLMYVAMIHQMRKRFRPSKASCVKTLFSNML